jgi:hypothetical protein
MGILTRRQGNEYVITSDHTAEDVSRKHAPRRLADVYQVWTGAGWSIDMAEAMKFESLEDADEYVREHYAKVRI